MFLGYIFLKWNCCVWYTDLLVPKLHSGVIGLHTHTLAMALRWAMPIPCLLTLAVAM